MWSKKACQVFTSTADDEISEKELETCYDLVIVVNMRIVLSQEAEVNMTESVAVPGHHTGLLVGTRRCGPDLDLLLSMRMSIYTLLSSTAFNVYSNSTSAPFFIHSIFLWNQAHCTFLAFTELYIIL